MTVKLFSVPHVLNRIAVSEVDQHVPGSTFFLDFSRPLEAIRWFGVWNKHVGFLNGVFVPIIHEKEEHGRYVIALHKSDPNFSNVLKLWKSHHPLENLPPSTKADGLTIMADFGRQFPRSSQPAA